MKYIIGIDGGGTKTDFSLCDISGRQIERLISSSSNPNDVGIQKAGQVLVEGIRQLCRTVGDEFEIEALYAGLSGGITGDNKEQIHKILLSEFPNIKTIDNSSDMVNSLSCAVLSEDGCAVISGTGSIAFVRRNGTIRRIGGWGYLLDRGGSGYDIGRDALYYSLCAFDGRGQPTILTDYIEQKLHKSIDSVVGDIYLKGKVMIASLAPLVFSAAREGDMIAQNILEQNFRELSTLINTAASEFEYKCSVVLTGGIFSRKEQILPILYRYVPKGLCFVFPEQPPVFGAVVEAAALAKVIADEAFRINWRSTMRGFI